MSETSFCELKSIVSHLPKSKILAGDAVNNGRYKFYLSGKKVARSDVAIVDQDAIVMGDGGVASITFATGKYSYSSHNFGFYSNSDDFLSEYIFRALEQFLPEIDYKGFVGSGIKNIDKNFLFDLHVEKISLAEQKKIASILTSVDEVIENTQKQIDKLQDLKKATMNELLTKGIGHTEFKDSELGRIPKSWEIKALSELAVNGISNGVFNDPKMQGSGYRLINVFDMYQGFGINDQKLKKLKLTEKEFQKNKVEYGDIFLTRSSLKLEGIAHCNICLTNANDITYDGHLMKISPNTSIVEPIFLALQCLSDLGRIFLMRMAKQSTMTTIGQEDIAPLSIVLPPLEEQRTIIDVHSGFEIRIRHLKTKLMQTQFLKSSLMQDLLTGKVRVQVN